MPTSFFCPPTNNKSPFLPYWPSGIGFFKRYFSHQKHWHLSIIIFAWALTPKKKMGEARIILSASLMALWIWNISSSKTHIPVSSHPPQFWHGEILMRLRLNTCTLNPESSIPLIVSFRRSSVFPSFLGLPRNAMIFI